MGKNGNRPIGSKSLRPPVVEVEPYENPLPPPPLNVIEKPKGHRPGLSQRSPLSVAFRHIPGGWRRYIEYVDLAARRGDEAMARFCASYGSLTSRDKASVWPEQVCDLASVSPGDLVAAVCKQIWETKAAESSMISSIAHPEILMSTIKWAKKECNGRDRELYFRLAGSLPDRKGTSINIFNQAAGVAAQPPELAQPAKMRSFDDEIIEMDRDLETPNAPFVVKGSNVPPDDYRSDD